jgi:hypothetical protein
MRRLLTLIPALAIATSSLAVAPQFWRVTAAEDFLGGEIEGFAVTSRGELRVAPAMKKIATFTDPFVLSQTAAPNGDRFFGTGNDGKVYRLRGEELKLVFTAPEPEIYALAWRDGALFAGSSPDGKVYRVDPDSGKHTAFFDPAQAYIWTLEPLPGGELAVGTGVEGKLFRVNAKGEGKVLYDAPDTHIRSLAARRDGSLLAGASGKGRIYEVQASGAAHALYDSSLNEISSIYVDNVGIGWAAGVSNVLPSSAPAKQQKPAQGQQQQQGGSASGEQKKEGEPASTVEVSFSFEDSAAAASAQSGSSEVYKIHGDGFVETVQKLDREMVYAISASEDGGAVLLATGPNGRIYELRDGELALVGSVPEKQVVSISTSSAPVVTTTNTGAVYRIQKTPAGNPEFRSAPKDVERFSRFGNYRIEGRNLDPRSMAIAFRSGNTRTPDETWSAWSAPQNAIEGSVPAPPGRYIQWKLNMPQSSSATAIDGVSIAFINRNVAPEIDAIAVQDPAVVFIASAYPSSPQVVEATNPDEYGIFSSLDNPRERAAADPGKRVFRKGFRTVTWRASDDNGDSLRYTLSFRQKGTERWLRLRENMEETQLNFDTSQLPDGRYELRLAATDAADNPDAPLSDTKEGLEFLVDNGTPSITATESGDEVTVRITDALSAVGKVEYSADAQRWIRITPVDGIADSRDETFKLKRSAVAGKFVIVRAVDAYYNVATESITLK